MSSRLRTHRCEATGASAKPAERRETTQGIAVTKDEEISRLRAALERIVMEGKVYAAHNALEPCAQRMYDHADEALRGGKP